MWSRRSDSSCAIRVTGIPVHIDTTWAISSSSTVRLGVRDLGLPGAAERLDALPGGCLGIAQAGCLLVLLRIRGGVLVAGCPLQLLLGLPEIRRRRRVAQAHAAGCLVDEVDRLVREVAIAM